jgi:hypothetical protein
MKYKDKKEYYETSLNMKKTKYNIDKLDRIKKFIDKYKDPIVFEDNKEKLMKMTFSLSID